MQTREKHAHLFSASWRSQQESQKNLFFWQSISLALNWRRHAVTDEFCSMSIDKSKKDSSLAETVSHVRHRVSLVRTPSNRRWTRVPTSCWWCAVAPDAEPFVVSAGMDNIVGTD